MNVKRRLKELAFVATAPVFLTSGGAFMLLLLAIDIKKGAKSEDILGDSYSGGETLKKAGSARAGQLMSVVESTIEDAWDIAMSNQDEKSNAPVTSFA